MCTKLEEDPINIFELDVLCQSQFKYNQYKNQINKELNVTQTFPLHEHLEIHFNTKANYLPSLHLINLISI